LDLSAAIPDRDENSFSLENSLVCGVTERRLKGQRD
jgi:hypothetical protein